MFKLIDLSGDTIRLDDKAAALMVSRSCARCCVRVEGIIAWEDRITLICSDDDSGNRWQYNFTSLGDGIAEDDIFTAVRSRYDNNFRTIGAFKLDDGYWTITEKNIDHIN